MDDGTASVGGEQIGRSAANRPRRKPTARRMLRERIPVAPPAQDGTLHLEVLDHQKGVGTFACGWIDDRQHRVEQILAEGSRPAPVDLLREAALSTAPDLADLLAVPCGVRAPLTFVLFLPDETVGWAGGLTFTIVYSDGMRERCFVPAVGRIAELDRIVECAPQDDALDIATQALSAWQRNADTAARLPRPLAELADRAHRKIAAPADSQIDTVLRAVGNGILLRGRFAANEAHRLREAALVSLFGRRFGLPVPLPAIAGDNPDDALGFLVFAEIGDLRADERCWFLEATLDDGSMRRLPLTCPPAPRPIDGIKAALGLVDPRAPNLAELFRGVLEPAVESFAAEARRCPPATTEIAYGERSGLPQVSIIVPLYRRIDFLQHQIASFSNDPELRSSQSTVELVYVLDDPARRGDFEGLCRQLYDVYGVPFRALISDRNLGYSGANNLGARAASGAALLLLNSDVLPKRGRWVGQLLKSYRALPRCGILGCRLLLEDDSIQHAGMTFRRTAMLPEAWANDHPHKGLPTTFDGYREATRVAAVTGACLMIDRALFFELGGLSEEYVLGDFEDSDLCLRAARAGWDVYYTPEVELYHLERQSIELLGEADWRQTLTLYNMWRHSRKWAPVIRQLTEGGEANSRPSGEDGAAQSSISGSAGAAAGYWL